jgi:hypothetical protein
MQVPRLAKGKGYKGPDFYGCFNTGMAPAIFHSRCGKYYVGPEILCRDAMRNGIGYFDNRRGISVGRQRIWIFKGRAPAVRRFSIMCEAATKENDKIRQEHIAAQQAASCGDIAAALSLGDF